MCIIGSTLYGKEQSDYLNKLEAEGISNAD